MTLDQAIKDIEGRFKRVETAPPESSLVVPSELSDKSGDIRVPFVVVSSGENISHSKEAAIAEWCARMESHLAANPGRDALFWRIPPELLQEREHASKKNRYRVYSRLAVL